MCIDYAWTWDSNGEREGELKREIVPGPVYIFPGARNRNLVKPVAA